ncbi:MAG: hypothetical protein EOP45_08035 [Sphingobacteriaceae bacterium]|nr:MAG: hypothetical protein EOP45_08035 [Sphingobacteriaceae bacterium]
MSALHIQDNFIKIQQTIQQSPVYLKNIYCLNEKVHFIANQSSAFSIEDIRHFYVRARWISCCRKIIQLSRVMTNTKCNINHVANNITSQWNDPFYIVHLRS